MLNWIIDWLNGCVHSRTTLPHRDNDGDYQRCLQCGKRIPSPVLFGSRQPPWGEQRLPEPGTAAVFEAERLLEMSAAERDR